MPGYKGGGPQRTVENICDYYSNKADIYILALNHDHTETIPYDVPTGKWIEKYGVHIMYVPDKDYGFGLFRHLYHEFDYIYACGLFAKASYEMMAVNRVFRDSRKVLFVAPMGVFSKGAISQKQKKKKIFLSAYKITGMYKNIVWSFTSNEEESDAKRELKNLSFDNCIIAEDLPRLYDFENNIKQVMEHTDISDEKCLKLVFLSRIVAKKTLSSV